MRRERAHTLSLLKKTSPDQIAVKDEIVVRRVVLGKEENCKATVIEIKQVEEEQDCDDPDLNETHQNGGAVLGYYAPYMDEDQPCTSSSLLSNNNSQQDNTPQPSASNSSSSTTSSKKTLYYVHYLGMDRRLDEWVDAGRIVIGEQQGTPTLTPLPLDGAKTLTRSQRRFHEEFHHLPKSFDDMDAYTAKLEKEHEERTKVKNIVSIEFGEYEIDAWYFSPFPKSITANKSKLYFCEFCLYYTTEQESFQCHMLHRCSQTTPPGECFYREGNLAMFEVEGRTQRSYAQSLCLLSKLFLDHKTLYYDVEGFLFYVLCELDPLDAQAHMVGHFSKEINSVNNLACIMVLPPFQRNGYGKLLIQLSYCLSEREGLMGTPEKPLSDLGRVSYRSYWIWVLIRVLDEEDIDRQISVSELSRLSGIHAEDIISIFHTLKLIKYWKGDHVVRVSRKIVNQIKESNFYHPPKLILNHATVVWRPKNRLNSLNNHSNN